MEGYPKRKKPRYLICESRAHKFFICPQRREESLNPNKHPLTSLITARVTLKRDSSEDNSMIYTLAIKYTYLQSPQSRFLIYRLSIKKEESSTYLSIQDWSCL